MTRITARLRRWWRTWLEQDAADHGIRIRHPHTTQTTASLSPKEKR